MRDPVRCLRPGGVPDLIGHRCDGYLARPYEPEDLAEGIAWVLENEERRREMGERARRKVTDEFALEKVARRYVGLYDELLRDERSRDI